MDLTTSEQLAEVKKLAERIWNVETLTEFEVVQIYCMANRHGLYDAANMIKDRLSRNERIGILDWIP